MQGRRRLNIPTRLFRRSERSWPIVGFWPECEVAPHGAEVRLLRQTGPDLLNLSSSHFDPNRTRDRNGREPSCLWKMPRYYFDSRDDDMFIADDEGLDFSSLDDVKAQATTALTELAKDVLPGSVARTLAIEVRDDLGPVLRIALRFEIEHIRLH